MIASAGAFHRIHVDGASLGTSVHLTHGAKLWFVAVSWEDGSPIEDQWLPEYFEGDQIELAARFKWEAILLEEGSTLCVLSALCITEF